MQHPRYSAEGGLVYNPERSALYSAFAAPAACDPLGFGEGTQSRVGEWRVAGAHAFNHHKADSVLRDKVQSDQVTQGSQSCAIKWPLRGEPPGSPACSRCRTGSSRGCVRARPLFLLFQAIQASGGCQQRAREIGIGMPLSHSQNGGHDIVMKT